MGARGTRAFAEDATSTTGSRACATTSKECVRGTHLRKGILLRRLWEAIQALIDDHDDNDHGRQADREGNARHVTLRQFLQHGRKEEEARRMGKCAT